MKRITAMSVALSAASVANAQWISFNNQTGARVPTGGGQNDPALTTTCPEEKDYAWGDVDHDGDLDVIIARKRPLSCQGGRPNVLLMNEGGVLVDRTNVFANTAIGVPGAQGSSQGFLDSTNDRQGVLVDLNNDGWLDYVTAPTMSDNLPRYIGYPRIYMNLGESGGVWQGFRYEYARMPQMSGPPASANPRFCSVAAGDINGDGYADLFFSDYDTPENAYCGVVSENSANDFNNRLLVNAGAANPGVFLDQTSTRLGTLANAAFGAHGAIGDMTGDGHKDIVRVNTLTSGQNVVVFSNPSSGSGFWSAINAKQIYGGAPYGLSIGDLNGDGRLDVIISDDSNDRYGINTGNDDNDNPNISISGFNTESEFSGQNSLVDMDNDGLLDVMVPDQDLDTNYNANRRMHIYHNLGGSFVEENSPFVLPTTVAKAVYNVATFDIDGDGWRDIILGKGANVSGGSSHQSGSTEVWMSNGKPGLDFSYPLGTPADLTPDQPTVFQVQLTGTFGGTPGASPSISVSVNGASFSATALSPLGGDLYQATIPAQGCGSTVRWYITGTSSGTTVTDPVGAPADFYASASFESSSSLLAEDFEGAAAGWSVQNDGSLTGGQWELGDPNATWYEGVKASPEDDATSAGTKAYVTGLGSPGASLSSHDVDGGPTHLISPAFDLSDGTGTVSFNRWFYSNTQGDVLQVAVSNNDGGTWVPVKSFNPPAMTNWNGPGEFEQTEWQAFSFNVSDYVTPSAQVRVRFTVNDVSPAGFVEAGVDDFAVTSLACAGVFCPADVTGNGTIDIDDLLAVINAWGNAGGPADINGSGIVDIDDLLAVINAWGSCGK